MRTTLTLDPDVQRLIEEEVHRHRKPFKQVVNDALRRGLAPRGSTRKLAPFKVTLIKSRLMPGIDLAHLNGLADELEDDAHLARMGRDAGSK